MSVGSVLIGLQASHGNGKGVTAAEFLGPMAIQSGEVEYVQADGGAWTSGMIAFSIIRTSDFAGVDSSVDAGAPIEAFFAATLQAFRRAAVFLDRRSPEIIGIMRRQGLKLRIFIDVRMHDDQMELEFPPEFMAACARHGLGLFIISNDVPAAETDSGT